MAKSAAKSRSGTEAKASVTEDNALTTTLQGILNMPDATARELCERVTSLTESEAAGTSASREGWVSISVPVRAYSPPEGKENLPNPLSPYHIDIGGMSSQERAAAAAIVSGCLRDEIALTPHRQSLCTSAAKALRYVLQLVAVEMGDPPLHLTGRGDGS